LKPNSDIQDLEKRIIQIIEQRDKAENKVETLEKIKQKLEMENQILKKRLAFYVNPHTPSSARKLSKKIDEKKPEKKKRGAPKGHKGATRPTPVPDNTIDVKADQCENCGSHNIEDLEKIKQHIIEDILSSVQTIQATQFNQYTFKCKDCGHEFLSKHLDCPNEGNFGPNLLVYMTMLKYHMRGTIRKVVEFLDYKDGFQISPKGVLDALNRVGKTCEKEYDQLLRKIRAAKWLHIDETGFHVNGEKWWLWIFRTDNDEVLIAIEPSRGRKVLNKILGENWNIPVIVDGWKSYWHLPIIQRCWSHLLREVDDFKAVSKKGKQLSKRIQSMFQDLREFIDSDPSMDSRKKQKEIWDNDMADLVNRFKTNKKLKKPLKYIENGLGNWFTCLLYPGMEPTNNLGEQAIRESVIIRKIIGTFRSENGSQYYQYIASLLLTWRLQGKNMFVELDTVIRDNLCLA
jgi:transposase